MPAIRAGLVPPLQKPGTCTPHAPQPSRSSALLLQTLFVVQMYFCTTEVHRRLFATRLPVVAPLPSLAACGCSRACICLCQVLNSALLCATAPGGGVAVVLLACCWACCRTHTWSCLEHTVSSCGPDADPPSLRRAIPPVGWVYGAFAGSGFFL